MATKDLTLAEAEALAQRLRAERDAADAAEAAGRRDAEMRIYTKAFEQDCPRARQARDAAAEAIGQLANTDPAPGIDEVWTAFIKLRDLDAEAGSMSVFASMIEQVAPLPDNSIGAPVGRPPGVTELYDRVGFGDFANLVVERRAERIRRQYLTELQAAAYSEIDKAGHAARQAAEENA